MSEKKEPPSDGRDVLALVLVDDVQTVLVVTYHARQGHPIHWRTPGRGMMFRVDDVVDWCEIAEWPDLVAAHGAAARLADAQARLDKAQARMLELESENSTMAEKLQEALSWRIRVAVALDCVRHSGEVGGAEYVERHAMALRRFAAERDDAVARAERAEKERDEARAANDVVRHMLKTRTAEVEEAMARAESAEKERDTLNECNAANILELTRADRLIGELRKERDQAIRERDEVGCQLEALRAVQRDDLQVLVARIALVEADVAGLKRLIDNPDAGLEGLVFEGQKGGE